MWIASIQVGFIEVPNATTLNIYAVGCKHACNGCHTKDLQDFNYSAKFFLDATTFSRKIEASRGLIDGIVWLGGDALFQREEFITLSRAIKSTNCSLFNCVYTGFLFEDVPDSVKVVSDIIIDGKWTGYTIDNPLTNQRIFKKDSNSWEKLLYIDFNKITPKT